MALKIPPAIKQIIREEITSGDINVAELVNTILESIRDSLSQPTSLRGIRVQLDNSGGASPAEFALFDSSTPSKLATIYYPTTVVLDDFTTVDQSSAPTLLVGQSGAEQFPLEVGGKIETEITDLSAIYVKVPAGVSVYLYVLYEA